VGAGRAVLRVVRDRAVRVERRVEESILCGWLYGD